MKPRTLLPLLLLALPPLAGCGSLGVSLHGDLQTPLLEPVCSTEAAPVVLAFDPRGNLTVNGQVLELPRRRERRRLGVGVVDVGPLPAIWRPAHAADGGILVASLQKASPLAIAGLRPFDRVRSVNGEQVSDVKSFVARIDVDEGTTLRLEVVKPDGREETLEAEAGDLVGDSSQVHVPFLFERRSSPTGHALGFAPFDALFYYRTLTEHTYVEEAEVGHTQYNDRFEWGVLGNLLLYESVLDSRSGEQRSRFRLFWLFSFGDDL